LKKDDREKQLFKTTQDFSIVDPKLVRETELGTRADTFSPQISIEITLVASPERQWVRKRGC
jgi:hypothetical protein